MLYIKLGITPNTIINVDDNFNFDYEDDWFEDPMVKKMVLDIDKTEAKLEISNTNINKIIDLLYRDGYLNKILVNVTRKNNN